MDIDGRVVKLQIWDTAGQERFRTITSAYYRGADGILLVFDRTNEKSLENIDVWLQEVERFTVKSHVSTLLVANKSDLTEGQVSDESINAFCEAHDLKDVASTSARTGEGVEGAFFMITENIIARKREEAAAAAQAEREDLVQQPNNPCMQLLMSCCPFLEHRRVLGFSNFDMTPSASN